MTIPRYVAQHIDRAVFAFWAGANPAVEAGVVADKLRHELRRNGFSARKIIGRVYLPQGVLDVEVTMRDGLVVSRTYEPVRETPDGNDDFGDDETVVIPMEEADL